MDDFPLPANTQKNPSWPWIPAWRPFVPAHWPSTIFVWRHCKWSTFHFHHKSPSALEMCRFSYDSKAIRRWDFFTFCIELLCISRFFQVVQTVCLCTIPILVSIFIKRSNTTELSDLHLSKESVLFRTNRPTIAIYFVRWIDSGKKPRAVESQKLYAKLMMLQCFY